MCSTQALTACCILLLSVAIMGAPLENKKSEVQKRSANKASETPDQEKDLQDLLNLVHKESNQNDVVVHKEEVSHFENNNGQKVQVQAKEEKVVDKNTGNVIADVKQEVKQASTGTGSKPETLVETKVDIPAEGVHETFVQEGEENSNGEENSRDEVQEEELTPADMAEYLYATQRFPEFYTALERLVNQSKMTPEEAEMYTRAVALEYEGLQLEDFEETVMAEKRQYPQVPQDMDIFGQDSLPEVYPHSRQEFGNDEKYAQEYYGYPTGYMNPEDQAGAQQEIQANAGDINPYAFVAALFNEAYGKGNEEAQEIVRMLNDRVSQDDNPNDMAQIKDLLVQTIAESMNEDPEVEETQLVHSENQATSESDGKLKEAETRVVEQVKEEKIKQEKQNTQTKQKEEKEQKASEKVGNKNDHEKQ